MYAGCISGAVQKNVYLDLIKDSGFINTTIQKEKIITVPDDILIKYLNDEELKLYKESKVGIFSITVYAEKPKAECCDKESCCK